LIGRTRSLLRALHSRNYRLFVAGQGISLIGTWMQQVAMSWLVYRLTGSAMLLGIVGFTGQIPSFLLAPVAGVLADRWEKRRLLFATQTLALIQAALLSVIVLTGVVQIWHNVLLSLFLGMINAFDIPVRQSFVVQMVDSPEDLSNAIALNSSMVHGARLIGPTIAGLLVAVVGEGVCFAVNSASYLAVIAALAAMRVAPQPSRMERHNVLHELREGVRYAFGFKPIRSILLMLALVSLMGMPFSVLIPVCPRSPSRKLRHLRFSDSRIRQRGICRRFLSGIPQERHRTGQGHCSCCFLVWNRHCCFWSFEPLYPVDGFTRCGGFWGHDPGCLVQYHYSDHC
jgi:MFS family permease